MIPEVPIRGITAAAKKRSHETPERGIAHHIREIILSHCLTYQPVRRRIASSRPIRGSKVAMSGP